MKNGGRLHKIWLGSRCWAITLDGKLTWWSPDDVHQRERKLDVEIQIPAKVWKPYCWIKRNHTKHRRATEYYGACVFCSTSYPESPYSRGSRAPQA